MKKVFVAAIDRRKKSMYITMLSICFLLVTCPFFINSYFLSLLTQVLIFGILAMSLDILIGYGGMVSFNHATFFGVSGYTVGILFHKGIDNFWLALSAGVFVSAIFAGILGLIVLRSTGPYFLMMTLAFGQMFFALAWKWRGLTGGDDGLPGIPRPDIGIPLSMWENKNFYYLVLFFLCITFLLLNKILSSRLGKVIMGVRESDTRMQALGYNTWLVKYLTYILAACAAGLAGVLNAYYTGFISPQELNWTTSGLVMLMVIIGGAGTLAGPISGAAAILVIQNVVSSYTQRWAIIMGVIFIFCVMYARKGLAGFVGKLYGDKNM